ncbi:hypothetical protein MJ579_17515 [Klebsiella pneumoniae]|nr:hypothetical protein MJ579_17515 [Klebsiella pneumoniae]
MPATTKILTIGEVTNVDESEPFVHEKTVSTPAMYRAKDFEDAVAKAETGRYRRYRSHLLPVHRPDNQPARALLRQMMKPRVS